MSLMTVQDLGGLRMSMLNANTIKVFKAMSAIYQDHYPVRKCSMSQTLVAHCVVSFIYSPCCVLQPSSQPACLFMHAEQGSCSPALTPLLHLQELMTRMFLVNIPMVFAAVWRVVQMFIDDRVKAKIRFLRKADLATLHEFIDRDLLPEGLGGKFQGKLLSDSTGGHCWC